MNKEAEKNNSVVAKKLEKVLLEFGVEGQVINFQCGPVVTLFEFVPAPGIKNSKIVSLSNDIARSMSSLSARISSQPGKTSIGIEIPNSKREPVYFGDLIREIELNSIEKIELALGKDIAGKSVFADLKKGECTDHKSILNKVEIGFLQKPLNLSILINFSLAPKKYKVFSSVGITLSIFVADLEG